MPMNIGLNFLMVGAGGALGACARFAISIALNPHDLRFPLATLLANIAGALLAGFVVIWLMEKGLLGTVVHLFLMVGFLGGFTTFSAFSVETLRLMEAGNMSYAVFNIGLNVAGSLIAVAAGASLARSVLS